MKGGGDEWLGEVRWVQKDSDCLFCLLCVVTLCVVTLVTVRGDTCNLAVSGFFRSLCFTGLAPRSCSFFLYSGRSCLMEMKGTMSMCSRVRWDGSRKIGTAFSCLLCVMTLLITFNIRPSYKFYAVLFTRCACFNRGVNVFLPEAGGLTSKKPALLTP